MLPEIDPPPPFTITRASHLVLTSRDLAKARDFYTEVIGLKVSNETATTIHFRGVEERAHHSLTLRATKDRAECECIGFRASDEQDVENAFKHFEARGFQTRFVNVPFQSRTLRVNDIGGTPLEFCARMKALERSHARMHEQKGAAAQRLNHFQILVPDVATAVAFYCAFGFRVFEYTCVGERLVGALLHRKDDPHDLVLQEGPGPRLHHVAYIVQETHHLIRAIDAASHLKSDQAIEQGPVRHDHSFRLYVRDPDGHRIALLLPPFQVIDADDGGERHDVERTTVRASHVLHKHATPFTELKEPFLRPVRVTAQSGDRNASGLRETGSCYLAEGDAMCARAHEVAI